MRWVSFLMMAGVCSVAVAQSVGGRKDKPMHMETKFEVLVHAPYEETAVLFGPEGERAWAGASWDPKFVYPIPGQDEQGAVFTIRHGLANAVWVVAQHDVNARHFQYVYFIAGVMVTTIDVRFQILDSKTTNVTVIYARTAICADGEEHVKTMSEGDQTAGKDWQAAIDKYFESRTPSSGR